MNKLSRRQFIKKTAALSTAFSFPAIVPSSALGRNAPSNRIVLGFIGVRNMGLHNLRAFRSKPNAQIAAVCDVDADIRKKAMHEAGLGAVSAYNDFRDLIARKDIDAVVIATPDHWHVPISLAAARAGKDIYCEKPLTLTIREGRLLSDIVSEYKVVLQTGSQQRSDEKFRFACELVRNGRIGALEKIKVELPMNNRSCPNTWSIEPVPKGFDYERWLGPAPWAPFTTQRCHYQFRFIRDYSGGQMTNWGAHYLDIAQWALDADKSGPVEIEGKGKFPKSGLFNTPTEASIKYTYDNGVEMYCKMTGRHSIDFWGSEGRIYVTRGKIEAWPASLLDSPLKSDEERLYCSNDHHQNFLDCIETRRQPVAPAETGHRSATVCHLGNISLLLETKLRWDPHKECFISNNSANQMIARSARSPWT